MSYTMKTKYGKNVTIERYAGDASLSIEGGFDVLIRPKDAPAFALAVLKAAGFGGKGEFILVNAINTAVACLENHIDNAERNAKTEALTKRRDELARDLDNTAHDSTASILTYHAAKPNLRVAIDRIIELEAKS